MAVEKQDIMPQLLKGIRVPMRLAMKVKLECHLEKERCLNQHPEMIDRRRSSLTYILPPPRETVLGIFIDVLSLSFAVDRLESGSTC